MSSTKELGKLGEEKAYQFLIQQGLKLVTKNFYSRFGEIDLIMLDNEFLIFIEVRSRKNMGYGNALESVTISKQKKLRKTADYFLLTNKKLNKKNARFDVLIVPTNTPTNDPVPSSPLFSDNSQINWLKNAF